MTALASDKTTQLYNSDFLLLLRKHLITDSFGYEQFPEQKQLLKLAIDFYFPLDINWQTTCKQLTLHRQRQKSSYSKDWLYYLLDFYGLFLFCSKSVSLQAIFSSKFFVPSDFLLFLRKQISRNFSVKQETIDQYFSKILDQLNYQDILMDDVARDLNLIITEHNREQFYIAGLPELEPRSVIKFSEAIRTFMTSSNIPLRDKFHWKSWIGEYSYWQMFFIQMLILAIISLCLFWGIKTVNHYYEKIIIDKITLLEPNFLWLDTNLTFKNESDIPKKEIRLSSTQIDELEKLERVEQSKFEITEFLPESDIIDTSVSIAGWVGLSGNAQDFSSTEDDATNIGNEYRDIYDGFSKSYRLMLNSADLFDMRQKLIGLFRNYGVKEANIPMVGKESLDGVYFNVFIPATKIQNFINEVGGIESTNTYISKTSYRPPQGYERVFIWVKRI